MDRLSSGFRVHRYFRTGCRASFKTLTPEEKATYRSWRRAVMAFYCAVVLLGGLCWRFRSPSRRPANAAQVMPPVNVP